jgi:PIN domain nuclease of toxin-antitoxin system
MYVSAAVVWELSIKMNLGKVAASALLSDLQAVLFARGFRRLAISTEHALRAGRLPMYHKDPFDRMLVAQAQAHKLAVVTADRVFDRYAVERIW